MTTPSAPSLRSPEALAAELELPQDAWAPYGRSMAKVDHRLASAGEPRPGSRYVLVTAINPTPAGEGKTVHTIGLSMALTRAGKRTIATLRQPSMGPVFGVKGGGAGGGRASIEPAETINLHLTGDFHAVAAANNLLAAALDTSLVLKNPLRIDPEAVTWRRVLDVNDRALRHVRTGLGGAKHGVPRDGAFDITSASEVMAILALASDLPDLRARLGRIRIGVSLSGEPVTAEQLEVAGAMAAIMRDTLDPTLVQTAEGTPVLVHAGPFANIAHGNCSVIADRMAARLADYVVTEAGFGADMGAEKFFHIKCLASGMRPDAVVLVATVRALKVHSGEFRVKPGRKLPAELGEENLAALEAGSSNLVAHLENLAAFGVPVVVAVNRFPTDTDAELELVQRVAKQAGARAAVVSEVFGKGGAGGDEMAAAVIEAAESGQADFRPLLDPELSVHAKIDTLARRIYGAGSVRYAPEAMATLEQLAGTPDERLPVCMAKTQYSLSHDAALLGRPREFEFLVRELRVLAGAGFVVPLAGEIQTMPGMGRRAAYKGIDVESDGTITGLF